MNKSNNQESRTSFFDLNAWRYFINFYQGQYKRLAFSAAASSAQSLIIIPSLLLIRYVFDEAIPQKNIHLLVLIGIGIFTFNLVNSAISLWIRSITIDIIRIAIFKLREDLLSRIFMFSRSVYSRLDLKTTHARIVQDTERLSNMSDALVSKLLPSFFISLALCLILLFLNWFLFLVVISIFPVLFFANRYTGKIVKKKVYIFQRSFETFSKGVLFVLRYMDLTKTQTAEFQEMNRQNKILKELKTRTGKMAFIYAVHGQVQSTLTGLSGITILVVGGYSVATQSITIGEFISFYVAMRYLNGRVSIITASIPNIIEGNESLVILHQIVKAKDVQPYHGKKHIQFKGCISIESVSFSYDDHTVLENVSLNLHPHSKIAIIGANGTGKSTITQLILGFYRPNNGYLYADNIPYEELDIVQLRKYIGVVMQDPPLFSGTILENISYGIPVFDRKQIINAARLAMADEFIQKLPEGYDTEIGEEGILLSGGERQRLAIACALLRQPKLLILDEPTNHLDKAAVGQLMDSLDNLDGRPAILMISHDLGVVSHADEVYQLEKGILVPHDNSPAVPQKQEHMY